MIHIIGASGRSGAALARSLLEDGHAVTPVVRSAERWQATGLPGTPRFADLGTGAGLALALAGATLVVSCAHARYAPIILAAAPPAARFVFLGSTRKFSRWPDEHGDGVRAGEAAFLASGREGVMLHPTMIYGADGEDNVRRLVALLRRLPIIPLPGGGRALVQPIHQSDVTNAIRAVIGMPWQQAEAVVIAGPTALSYADFVRAVATAAGLPRPRIVPIPSWPLRLAAHATAFIPGLPEIEPAEIRRLLEDKAFDIAPMRDRLGICPVTLSQGLGTMRF
jgi:nucleoside-diphosphate-sugar epimerase